MCYLITLDPHGNTAIAASFRKRGFEVSENCNPHIRRAFGAAGQLFDISKGGCSCSIYTKTPVLDEQAERHSLQRRGWSKANRQGNPPEEALDQARRIAGP